MRKHCVEGFGHRAVKLTKKIRKDAERIGSDQMNMVAHDDEGVDDNASFLCSPGGAVLRDLIGFGVGPQAEGALVGSASEQVRSASNDAPWKGHRLGLGKPRTSLGPT
jgi:hypothetical protein